MSVCIVPPFVTRRQNIERFICIMPGMILCSYRSNILKPRLKYGVLHDINNTGIMYSKYVAYHTLSVSFKRSSTADKLSSAVYLKRNIQ